MQGRQTKGHRNNKWVGKLIWAFSSGVLKGENDTWITCQRLQTNSTFTNMFPKHMHMYIYWLNVTSLWLSLPGSMCSVVLIANVLSNNSVLPSVRKDHLANGYDVLRLK